MTKLHTFYWILAIGLAVVLWAARRVVVKRREVMERTAQREMEFLTQFPQLADALDSELRSRR